MGGFLDYLLLLWNCVWPMLLAALCIAIPGLIYVNVSSSFGNWGRALAPIFIGIYLGLIFIVFIELLS